MDGDKFNIKLPSAVDEYYEVKEKVIKAGWEPGKKKLTMSGSAEEATINPDGSTTFTDGAEGAEYGNDESTDESTDTGFDYTESNPEPVVKGIDPAIYLVVSFLAAAIMFYFYHTRSKQKQSEEESFFFDMDGDKFNIKLPSAVDEYYEVKEKAMKAGWEPGKKMGAPNDPASAPGRMLAQALMKRSIADIPLVTHIQKESPGMNKLYSQSMCSVKQWQSYQAAESLVSGEVEEVRAEAEDIEPGWSQTIWRQAMQYHNMLKNKHETEMKQREEAARMKIIQEEEKKKPKLTPEQEQRLKEIRAEKAAEELIKMEERENSGKKAFANGGMKKGFLSGKKK